MYFQNLPNPQPSHPRPAPPVTDVTEYCLGLRADEGGGARQAAAGVGSAGVIAPAVAEQPDVLLNGSGGQPQLGQLGALNRYS